MSELTDKEREVLDALVKAHELYVQLPLQHPLHQQEWTQYLHILQRLIMSRPTARDEKWIKS